MRRCPLKPTDNAAFLKRLLGRVVFSTGERYDTAHLHSRNPNPWERAMNRVTVCVLAAAVGCAAVMASDIPPPRAVDVAALVRQLGSEDFAEREAATERLSTLKVDQVPPELLAALKSSNPEVRERAAR